MKVALALLTVELFIGESHSLKERRSVVKSLKDRIANRFNVSVAEAEDDGKWQVATLLISCAGSSPGNVEGCLKDVAMFIESDDRVQVSMPRIRFYE